jgi:UDP-N-acetylmuramoylalanine--D-glutamate ligase
VAEKKGVKFYNDSFSTVPETAIAAIKSFDQPIVLILGGSDKGSDYRELGKVIEQANIRAIIFIGDMAEKISKSIGDKYKGERIFGPKKMDEIVKTAADIAQKGDVVLLSPACASFGLFENYKDRGNQFKALVSSLG